MTRLPALTFVLILVWGWTASLQGQIPNTLSYQGILTDSSGTPKPDGTYSFTFRLYDVSTGGIQLWRETKQLAIKKGLFSTELGDQFPFSGSADFSMPYWLGIQVESEPELSPRIPFSSVAYSFRSINAETSRVAQYALSAPQQAVVDSARIAGAIPDDIVSTSKLQVLAVSTSNLQDGAVTTLKIADGTVQAGDIAQGQVIKSLNGLQDNIVLQGAGGATVTSQGDSLIITASGGGGTGIQGVQNTNNTLDITDPNGPTATINLKLPFSASTSTSATTFGVSNLSSGVGLSGLSVNGVGVLGGSADTGQFGVWGINTGGGYGVGGSSGGTTTAGVWGSNSAYGIGVKGSSLNGVAVQGLMTGTGRAGYFEIDNPSSSNIALYTVTNGTGSALYATGKGKTLSNATLRIENTEPDQGMSAYLHNSSNFATTHFQNDGAGEVLWVEHHGTGHYIVATSGTDWKFWVDNNGVTHTKVLEIIGGSDLSEWFEIKEDDVTIEPGMVVSIDDECEGRLMLSQEPYDRRVAGIISGAGNIKPGMLMGQEGSVASGKYAIALTGRVYCWVTANNGPISPGDLLTTSAVPGYAMRVDDHPRAQGAIIGKAMSGLSNGTGLVLVLVNLQ